MAIDTENKRRSALSRFATPLPVPDLIIGILDRPHVWWIYRGISTVLPVTVVDCRIFTPALETRVLTTSAETRLYTVPADRVYTPGCE